VEGDDMMKKTGRPTKYKSKFCSMLIEHMRQGLSFDTFAGRIEVNPDSLYEWVKRHPAFSEAKKVGTGLRNYLVESAYVASTLNPEKNKYNTAQLIYWTKNTLGWSDKIEHAGDDAKPITLNYKLE
jgi:hypothetical protein